MIPHFWDGAPISMSLYPTYSGNVWLTGQSSPIQHTSTLCQHYDRQAKCKVLALKGAVSLTGTIIAILGESTRGCFGMRLEDCVTGAVRKPFWRETKWQRLDEYNNPEVFTVDYNYNLKTKAGCLIEQWKETQSNRIWKWVGWDLKKDCRKETWKIIKHMLCSLSLNRRNQRGEETMKAEN